MNSPEVSKSVVGVKSPCQNLTGPARKLRDRSVDFINGLTRLSSLNLQGQTILNGVFAVYKKHDAFPDPSVCYSDFELVQESMEKLTNILQEIKRQVDIMASITRVLHEQLKLERHLTTPQFFDLSTQDICILFKKITDKQLKNYKAKRLTLDKLLVQKNSQDIFFLLSLWVREPYNDGAMEREVESLKQMVVNYNKT